MMDNSFEIVADDYGILFAKFKDGETRPIHVLIPESNYFGVLQIGFPEKDGE